MKTTDRRARERFQTPAVVAAGLLLVGLLPCRAAAQAEKQPAAKLSALHIKGTSLVTGDGTEMVLRGVNLGSWLVIEKEFGGINCPDEKSLWAGLERRFDKASMERIREAYRTAWIGPEDFER